MKEDAWGYLDWAIAEAKEREMYVVLDLHGAAGRQGWEHHSGCAGKNELWNSETYRDRTIWLWERIAEKYKGEEAIAGYGLLNEPWGAVRLLWLNLPKNFTTLFADMMMNIL